MYNGNRTNVASNSERILRNNPNRELKDYAKTTIGDRSFCINGAKLWNKAPLEIRQTEKLEVAKKLIKVYSKSIPV